MAMTLTTLETRPRADHLSVPRQPRLVERRFHGRTPLDMAWLAPPAVLAYGLFSTWSPGAILVRTGERIQHVDVLVEGVVDEITGGLVIHHDEPGTLLGAEGAVEGNLAPSTLRTRTLAVVITVPVPALRRVATTPETSRWIAEQLDARGREMTCAARWPAR
jgi:hypothetical protein